jgi:hypothetical protein
MYFVPTRNISADYCGKIYIHAYIHTYIHTYITFVDILVGNRSLLYSALNGAHKSCIVLWNISVCMYERLLCTVCMYVCMASLNLCMNDCYVLYVCMYVWRLCIF